MHITRYTDYSLRVLMYVALKGEELATIREIAESYEISKNHLMKVVQSLNSKGYLIAIRGKNGGVRLAGRPEDINVGHLVRDTEQDLALVECFNNGKGCVITPACELKRIFAEALEAFFQVLDQYTLADLLPKGKAQHMVRLLRIG
ncbi:RrF2 family transcriptional regulator [Microbulbifer thermotolerans]|uniref:Rrf2 family transcriptional regulator n=1 Tax=Microbulbifer thermotolerans TaxID=252514 RepID=A0A143HL26_MICTH|nr:Rrf2 family transcriptional regulator [Microbulbifer thermotolerans]AMX01962.1 Rrf2 family transcriptional regulator [Microbulbifer thermotolerans]MCX2780523.1 Rrf2 family transcriptional regulator [Microbulbifer thermotolerans]MCX2794218.1 Rrf2 family transcriptional regulator [Microbulbifer thermotolerans]MCX2803547.1 Rrf2 family transcriptional regulator [Microbulbifer thermotolerans]MCX2829979.1 Rrf2 family transcriptional regulator [Microbulbifer thermotolerans]